MQLINNFLNQNKFLLVFIIILKIFFLLNFYLVDDAYIVFRSAYNFGNFGEFSYNLGENFSGVTSWLYGLWTGLISVIFKSNFIAIITIINSFLSLVSSLLLYSIFINLNSNKNNTKNPLFPLLFFINPAICTIGTIGLETSFLVFFITLFFYSFYVKKNKILTFISGVLSILTRIELFSLFLIFIFSSIFKKEKNLLLITNILIFGIILNLVGNLIVNGSYFPQTAISKLSTLTPDNTYIFFEIIERFSKIFFLDQSYFIGFKTKFFPIFFNFLVSLLAISMLLKYIFSNIYHILIKEELTDLSHINFTLSLAVLAIPSAYIISGQIWEWYFLPFSFFFIILFSNYLMSLKQNILRDFIISIMVIIISSINFFVKYNISFQEHNFRSNVGKLINLNAENKSTLFLEPAGYIPYFAKIKTIDTVGLSSKKIREYRTNDNIDWWFDFVENEKPDFIVDRKNIMAGSTKDGYIIFTKEQNNWIESNYKLLKKFDYNEYLENYKFRHSIEKFIIKLGSHSNYYVFKKI